jgi:pyruvate-ferredoxin/flavodoxin oxidoreductase
MSLQKVTVDGNEAAAHTAYHVNESICIYPITPSSPMGELADQWAVEGRRNIWGTVPRVTEMQSEGGAAGAVHGSLQRGALTTTFTSSQGLLLMIPNMYKVAGELTPVVFQVAARTVATHALSIFCDHSDVMAARSTGFAVLSSCSVQEVMDFALIAQAASLASRVPFIHFFDGFRTSHEIAKISPLRPDDMTAMIDDALVREHRVRALSPDRPCIRGTAQNPDAYFQAREAVHPFYSRCPVIVQRAMERFGKITGRSYALFQYVGAPDAERVIVLMGSGAEVVHETVEYLMKKGEKVGVVKVRLYRPFSTRHFIEALPPTVKTIAALDRTKEPGSIAEPLHIDLLAALREGEAKGYGKLNAVPRLVGGRYGLSSKEFTPAMVKGIFDEIRKAEPKDRFTVGIRDDVSGSSLDYPSSFFIEPEDRTRAVFFGLGSDGTVSGNKNSIKIIGEETENYAQGYFVYDSRKAGSLTVSYLRFGRDPIHSPYLIADANFVGCHQFQFLERYDVLTCAAEGAMFLLNSPYGAEEVWDRLPRSVQKTIIDKKLRFFVIDAHGIASAVGLGPRINTVMQACFFELTRILPLEKAIACIKRHIKMSYGIRGESVVKMNHEAVDKVSGELREVKVPERVTSRFDMRPPVPPGAPEFVRRVTARMLAGEGDELPVSVFPPDGTFPSGTTKFEKRNIALEIPVWDPATCIQCGRCSFVCPHAVIRARIYPEERLEESPPSFQSAPARFPRFKGMRFTIQASPEDCTGCGLCVEVCPAKNKEKPRLKAINMSPQAPLRDRESKDWDFFISIPPIDPMKLDHTHVRETQFLEPLFEFSGACAGCGETPYLILLSKLFGDRLLIANATGCSSIYGGNLPTTPWTVNRRGRGPAWSNSLFEDNAEFGLGMRLALDKQKEHAHELLDSLSGNIDGKLVDELKNADQSTGAGIEAQRGRVVSLREALKDMDGEEAKNLLSLADVLVRKSVWIVGGDGWAYDIGYGGLDHVLALNRNVKVLVLDSEVYSNTGGQMSKATPRGAVAKFAAAGKSTPKKDLALMVMSYGYVYVARVAMGADYSHTIRVFQEAEEYLGPSLIIAYSHCIAHGYDLSHGMAQQGLAVRSGYWPLMRYNPELIKENKNPLQLDSKAPEIPFEEYAYNETRYKILWHRDPERAKKLLGQAQEEIAKRWKLYEHLASMQV